MPKYNLLSLYNVACMRFMADYLVLNNQIFARLPQVKLFLLISAFLTCL